MNEARSLQAVINCAAYLRCLKALQTRGVTEVTAAELAKAAQEELQTVREDLQDIIGSDEPYQVAMLSTCIRHYLGYDDVCTAVLVGVGNMGSAILSYRGFEDYGIDIVAAFDRDNAVIGTMWPAKGSRISPSSPPSAGRQRCSSAFWPFRPMRPRACAKRCCKAASRPFGTSPQWSCVYPRAF